MSILNGAVAYGFKRCASRLKDLLKTKTNRDEAVMELVRQLIGESKKIRFEGNGYSDEWKVEAKKRGLPILNTTADALEVFKDAKATAFLSELRILTNEELMSRYHINVERYVKTVEIEASTLIELVQTHVVPAIEKQILMHKSVHDAIKSATLKKNHQHKTDALETAYDDILTRLEALENKVHEIHKLGDETEKMRALAFKAMPLAAELREAADRAERLVADELWPLPKYREMLFANSLA
jgi:glutamine synthetase